MGFADMYIFFMKWFSSETGDILVCDGLVNQVIYLCYGNGLVETGIIL